MFVIKTIRKKAFDRGKKSWAREDEFMTAFNWSEQSVKELEDNPLKPVPDMTVKSVKLFADATEKWATDALSDLKCEYASQAANQMLAGMVAAFAATTLVFLVIGTITGLFSGWAVTVLAIIATVLLVLVVLRGLALDNLAFKAGLWCARQEQLANLAERLQSVKEDHARTQRNHNSVIRFMKDYDLKSKAESQPTKTEPAKSIKPTKAESTIEPIVTSPVRTKVTEEKLGLWTQAPQADQAQAFVLTYARMTREA